VSCHKIDLVSNWWCCEVLRRLFEYFFQRIR
jgi:hypothetical protein